MIISRILSYVLYLFAGLIMVAAFSIRLQQPELSETELFIEYGKEYIFMVLYTMIIIFLAGELGKIK